MRSAPGARRPGTLDRDSEGCLLGRALLGVANVALGWSVDGMSEVAYRGVMATSVERLAEQALKLSTQSRARLADLLVESLDSEDLGSIDRLWASEAKRRRDEVRSGRVKTISGAQARRRVRAAIRK